MGFKKYIVISMYRGAWDCILRKMATPAETVVLMVVISVSTAVHSILREGKRSPLGWPCSTPRAPRLRWDKGFENWVKKFMLHLTDTHSYSKT